MQPRDHFEIEIQGLLSKYRAGWFDGMQITATDAGHTLLTGSLADAAALFGVLDQIRDLGLELIAVRRLD
jgi:hypothetical protein